MIIFYQGVCCIKYPQIAANYPYIQTASHNPHSSSINRQTIFTSTAKSFPAFFQ